MLRQDDLFTTGKERQSLQLVLIIPEHIHAMPRAPTLQGLLEIVPLLFRCSISMVTHIPIIQDSSLPHLWQVGIGIDQRVNTSQTGRAFVFLIHSIYLLRQQCDTTHQRSLAVRGLGIVVTQHVITLCLIANHTQQVTSIITTVNTFLNKGLVVTTLHRSQHGRVFQCLVKILFRALLGIITKRRVHVIDRS